MDAFYERLTVRAATIDEILSDEFEPVRGQADAEAATRRFAAWCRHAASSDRALFERRLRRDHLTIEQVLERFGGVRRKTAASMPDWEGDAIWIEKALQNAGESPGIASSGAARCPFEQLFATLIRQADLKLWSELVAAAATNLADSARADLRYSLLKELTDLCASALYERFVSLRKANEPDHSGLYDRFVADMRAGGFRRLFDDRPVLLRLIATVTRQWIDVTREFIMRLHADLMVISRDLLQADGGRAISVEGDFSDPHNGGRSVRIVTFAGGGRIVYKPKDLRLDVAWHTLIGRFNTAEAPVTLRAVRTVARDGYGWSEFIAHSGTDFKGCKLYFRRAGAWLALLHCFAAADMHQENIIASGDHPVPIDLETIFHTTAAHNAPDPEDAAADAARDLLANSIMSVGLLPAYGRSPFNDVFAVGGLTAGWTAKTVIGWTAINSDAMRPVKSQQGGDTNPNLPYTDGIYAKFTDHIEDFIVGFADYAAFLSRQMRDDNFTGLFDGFSGVAVRKVIRPTKFYHMLIQRLKTQQTMDDGISWSAQADFMARLFDWDKDSDPLWPLLRAERAALTMLNVPYFTAASDGHTINDRSGISVTTTTPSGLAQARDRLRSLDAKEIAWQIEVIRENTDAVPKPASAQAMTRNVAANRETFLAEAGRIAAELNRLAIRRGPSAAWIGLDFLGDSEAFQLICLGPDLYNGECGIALFLAAYTAVTGDTASRALALAGTASLRKNLKSRNAARLARSLGLGGGTGLGSIVYALTAMATSLRDETLLADAQAVARLITDDLIAADKQLDAIGGCAGAILGLLRLHRDTHSGDALERAVTCGEHLLAQPRTGEDGRRSWVGQGFAAQPLAGMSHGASGFAYALTLLAESSGRDDFAQAAAESIAFEDANYDATRHNWPDLRGRAPAWPCQWCHGAAGIGLARAATLKHTASNRARLAADIDNAVQTAQRSFPGALDTLCCGTLGNIEFLCEAGEALGRAELCELAAKRLVEVLRGAAAAGDFRWNSGRRDFNLGLFRGLAGVGYTALRQAERTLPNVLIWG